MLLVETCRFHYSPQGGLHMFFRSCCVRHMFPLRATYFRQVLPHAYILACTWLSHAQSTMPDTTPTQPGSLHFRFDSPSCFRSKFRVTHSPVSGFPLRASISSSHIFPQESNGPPKFLCASLHTCHGLRTPPVLHILAFNG